MRNIDDLKKHWVYGLLALLVITIGGSWTVFNEILLKPKDEQIKMRDEKILALQAEREELKKQAGKIEPVTKSATKNYSITVGESIVIQEGKFVLNVSSLFVGLKIATLKIIPMSEAGKLQTIDITLDGPVIITNENIKLSINMLRILGNTIDITITKL